MVIKYNINFGFDENVLCYWLYIDDIKLPIYNWIKLSESLVSYFTVTDCYEIKFAYQFPWMPFTKKPSHRGKSKVRGE